MKTYPMAFIESPGKVGFRDCPLRDPVEGEVMIRVKTAAICGSDLHLFRGKHPSAGLPSAVGHEMAGVVVRCGQGVMKFKEGDRVTVEPAITCGKCHYCQRGQYNLCEKISFQYRKGQGAFAGYFYAFEHRVHPLPENVDDWEGTLAEPLAVALHAVKTSGIKIGQTCCVIGAGAIGLLVCGLVNNLSGMQPFVLDLNAFRRNKAIEFGGVDLSGLSSEEIHLRMMKLTQGLGLDVVFEAVGVQPTLVQALQSVRKGGVVTLIGIFEEPTPAVPVNLFVQKEISLRGSQGYAWDFPEVISMISSGRVQVGQLITSRLPIAELQHGFETLTTPGNQQIKMVFSLDNI